jgi:hypothetical protein
MALTKARNRMISDAVAVVTDSGATTGSADNTAAFQRAIDTGLDVHVPPGDWNLTGPVTLTTTGQILTGSGSDCRILSTSTTADIIRVGNGTDEIRGVVVKDINVYSTVTKTAGVAIRLRVAEQCAIIGCGISSAQDYAATGAKLYDGITFEEGADCTIDACSLWGFGRDAIRIYGGAVHNGEISIVGGTWITYAQRYGVYCGGRFGGLRLLDGDISACWRNLNIDQLLTPTYPNREIFIGSSFSIDASSDANIWVGSGGASTIEATGMWCASAGRTTGVGPSETNKTGIQIDPGNGSLTMRITGGKIYNCTGAGMTVNEGVIFLNDVLVTDNGGGAGLSDHGIWVVAGAGNEGPLQVTNCYFGSNGGYDLYVDGLQVYSRITDNVFRGSGTGTYYSTTNVLSETNIVQRNIGYRTSNQGTGTILSGGTSVVVNHGLAAAPSNIQVTANNTVPEGRGLAVSTVGATQFTVLVSTATAADRDFYWSASVGVQV